MKRTFQPNNRKRKRKHGFRLRMRTRGARGDRPSAGQGPSTPVGLTWHVRDRASFRALAVGRRHRRGALSVTRAVGVAGPPQVAYAVGRSVGTAVVRNRLRRRLRAATQRQHAHLLPGSAYLVGAAPAATQLSAAELDDALGDLFRRSRDTVA